MKVFHNAQPSKSHHNRVQILTQMHPDYGWDMIFQQTTFLANIPAKFPLRVFDVGWFMMERQSNDKQAQSNLQS